MPGLSLPERMHLPSLEVHHPDLGDSVLLIERNLGSEIVREGGIRHFDDEAEVAGSWQGLTLRPLSRDDDVGLRCGPSTQPGDREPVPPWYRAHEILPYPPLPIWSFLER
jgi:hypothetical protein